MRNTKRFLAASMMGTLALTMALGSQTMAEEKQKLVISCYLADDAQVAVREKYIDEPLQAAFPDVDIEIKMYTDPRAFRSRLQEEADQIFWIWTDRPM